MRYLLSAALLAVLLIPSPARAEWQRKCAVDSVNKEFICWLSAWNARSTDGTELTLRLLIYPDRIRVMVLAAEHETHTVPAILSVDRNAPWKSEAPRDYIAMFSLEESDAIAHELRQGKMATVQARLGVEQIVLRYNLLGTAEALETARGEVAARARRQP
jgi:hypothetical protein